MRLELFRTLWGETRAWEIAAGEARAAGFTGIEARIPDDAAQAARQGRLLRDEGIAYIAIALTGGGVTPRQAAGVEEHLRDLRAALGRAAAMSPRFAVVLGGNDRWPVAQQAEFIDRARLAGIEAGVPCVFETHRGRILSSPWIALDVLDLCPEALFCADISHWVVGCERLLDDPLDDLGHFIDRVHHIQARVGYDQGPQVPHPAADGYAAALDFHRAFWRSVWQSQRRRGYAVSTMTPEFGPDGYLHIAPFTNEPVADLWSLNRWIAADQTERFAEWQRETATS